MCRRYMNTRTTAMRVRSPHVGGNDLSRDSQSIPVKKCSLHSFKGIKISKYLEDRTNKYAADKKTGK